MIVGFHANQLGLRGTEVALYDYAHYNETILGNISYIFAPANSDMSALDKFKERFKDRVILYNSFGEIELSSSYKIDVGYFIKAGYNDGLYHQGIKNIIHAVFDASDKHGEVYVAVSEWLGNKYNVDYLPHIVSLPSVTDDFRDQLNIPREDIVFGRHGGFDQFDVPYLSDVLFAMADAGRWFLLMNTKPLVRQHPRIIYLNPVIDVPTKTAFINTCDAMIHGRSEGESFGLAISEFLHQNKPVITNINCRDRNHIHMLKDKGFYYSSPSELYGVMGSIEKKDYQVKNIVDAFSPEVVMNKFKTFLDA
jgi:hypothetical protein